MFQIFPSFLIFFNYFQILFLSIFFILFIQKKKSVFILNLSKFGDIWVFKIPKRIVKTLVFTIVMISTFLKFRESLTKWIMVELIFLRFSCLERIIITFVKTTSLISKGSKHIILLCIFSLTHIKRIEIERVLSFSLLNGIVGFLLIFCIKRIKLMKIRVL